MARDTSKELSNPHSKGQTIAFATLALLQLPYFLLKYIIPSQRPNKSWPYKAAVMNKLSKWMFTFFTYVRLKTPRSLEGGKEADLFVLAEPGPLSLYTGPLASDTIKPGSVGSIWVPSRPPATIASTTTIFLHFHGGAYVVLSPRMSIQQTNPRLICKGMSDSFALCVQYRLASNPGGTFPAQLQDAVTAYRFLVQDRGISPSRIVISGESAGGHLALSLIYYLQQYRDLLPLPRALLLHSPWLDLTPSGVILEHKRNGKVDYVPTVLLQWGADSLVPQGLDRKSPWISPMFHPFASSVPIWVQIGTLEALYDDVSQWVQAMKETEKNTMQLWEVPSGTHLTFDIAEEWGMKEKQDDILSDMVKFLRQIGL